MNRTPKPSHAWAAVAVVLAAFCTAAGRGEAAESSWKAGVSSAVITPDGPYWMGGYAARKKPSQGKIHDLRAKALAIEAADGTRFVIVTADLLFVTKSLAADVLRGVEKQHGLPGECLLLNASHTHCGPEVRLYRIEVHDIPQPYADKMHAYVESLGKKLIAVVGEALADLKPARLTVSQSTADVAINRRANRGADLPRLYKAGQLRGPTDHAVPVLCVENASGKRVAVLFGYACHNTVLSFYETCGDYAGFAQQFVEEANPGAIAMFVAGAGADQNPYPRRKLELARQHGKSLADAVNRALAGAQTELQGPLRVARSDALLEFQPHPDRATLQEQAKSSNRYQRWKANYLLRQLDEKREISRTYNLPVQVARFGDQMLLLAIGGEVVVDYSLRIKREYAGPMLWVAGYSNDGFGYLPSLRVLREGGYEGGGHMVYTKFPGPFTETVEDRVFATIDKLVKQVQSE